MKIDEALEVIAEAVRDNKIYNLKQALIKPLKKAYGVECLVFWTDTSNWFYCDYKFPNPNLWHGSHEYKKDDFDDLLMRLKWLNDGKGTVFFQGQRYERLEELKKDILIKELSGLT